MNKAMRKHFTVTGFIVHKNKVALHWHKHVKKWLPPGGHIEIDEDPVSAVHREVKEETGLNIQILSQLPYDYGTPLQLARPEAMAIYDMQSGDGTLKAVHQHIDFIYFCAPENGTLFGFQPDEWLWVDEKTIQRGKVVGLGYSAEIAQDVKELSLEAIKRYKEKMMHDMGQGPRS